MPVHFRVSKFLTPFPASQPSCDETLVVPLAEKSETLDRHIGPVQSPVYAKRTYSLSLHVNMKWLRRNKMTLSYGRHRS